ncbi:hypothetical protein AKJ16_DCAP22386 [Drosera capensis]
MYTGSSMKCVDTATENKVGFFVWKVPECFAVIRLFPCWGFSLRSFPAGNALKSSKSSESSLINAH